MLATLPFCEKDKALLRRNLKWMAELGGCHAHPCLLTHDKASTADDILPLAKSVFREVREHVYAIWDGQPNWPQPQNVSWQETARHMIEQMMKGNDEPWLWLEADAIPLKEGWLDTLEEEYKNCGKPFMGAYTEAPGYDPYMAGCGIYPANVAPFCPAAFLCRAAPWDMVLGRAIVPQYLHRANHLIQHMRSVESAIFATDSDLQMLEENAVIFHKCKNGTLIERLRENRSLTSRVAKFFRPKITKSEAGNGTIVVRRSDSWGDAIAATVVANKLMENGHQAIFQAKPTILQLLKLCQPALTLAPPDGKVDVNLNGAYEHHKQARTRHMYDCYIDTANNALAERGITLDYTNLRPVIKLKASDSEAFQEIHKDKPRPWIGIVPRSNSFRNRTVPDLIWMSIAPQVYGTCFWLGNHCMAPPGLVDVHCRDMFNVAIAESCMDLVVCPDTGPMHIAAAMGVPVIVIGQATDPELRLTDQFDFVVVKPALECLNCQTEKCQLKGANLDRPPCQNILSPDLVRVINKRLTGLTTDEVSAVITTYRSNTETLNRCISCVLPQVAEVIVTRNPETSLMPANIITDPKMRFIVGGRANFYYGRNMNYGVRHSNSKYVLMLNDDVFLEPNAIERLMDVMKADPKVGMVGHLLWFPSGKKRVQHAGITRVVRSNKTFGWEHLGDLRMNKPTEVEGVTGASVLIRRKAFYQGHGFDEAILSGGEDADVCFTMRKNGWKVMYTPHAQGEHNEHSTMLRENRMEEAEMQKVSRKVFDRKWGPYWRHNPNPRVLGNFDYLNR